MYCALKALALAKYDPVAIFLKMDLFRTNELNFKGHLAIRNDSDCDSPRERLNSN